MNLPSSKPRTWPYRPGGTGSATTRSRKPSHSITIGGHLSSSFESEPSAYESSSSESEPSSSPSPSLSELWSPGGVSALRRGFFTSARNATQCGRCAPWKLRASDGVERRRRRGLNARDGRRDAPGKVLKDRRSPHERGRMGTSV
eukprot:30358-Pelagococcus_subviridis.AAC.11